MFKKGPITWLVMKNTANSLVFKLLVREPSPISYFDVLYRPWGLKDRNQKYHQNHVMSEINKQQNNRQDKEKGLHK